MGSELSRLGVAVGCSLLTAGCPSPPAPYVPPAHNLVECRELGRGDMGDGHDSARATVLDASTTASLVGPDKDWLVDELEGLRAQSSGGSLTILVELGYGSGSETRPVVRGVETSGQRRLHVEWVVNPRGDATDDVTHEFVMVACPTKIWSSPPTPGSEVLLEITQSVR